MNDQDKIDVTDTFVPYDDHTNPAKLLKALGELLERGGTTNRIKVLEARTMLKEFSQGTPVQHRYEPKTARVSWAQRVLSWFRRD